MSPVGTDPDARDGRTPARDGAVAAGRGRARWTHLATILAVASLVVGAVAAVGLLGGDGGSNADVALQPEKARLGPVSGSEQTPLPDGTLLAFNSDDEIDVRDYVGQPLIVNFWASWCAPCVEEMPAIQQVADELDGRVTVLGINTQDSAQKAREFATDLGIGFALARDPSGSYFDAVGGFGWPTTLLVDNDGIVRYRHTGPLDASQLRDLLQTHLEVTP
jgi:cytochrome c biogenesis protein CcmG/thiol:disulfide interchange protein DsbE